MTLVGTAAKEIGKVSTRCYYVMGAAPCSYMRQLFLMGTAKYTYETDRIRLLNLIFNI